VNKYKQIAYEPEEMPETEGGALLNENAPITKRDKRQDKNCIGDLGFRKWLCEIFFSQTPELSLH
jgi:hypothetical protein